MTDNGLKEKKGREENHEWMRRKRMMKLQQTLSRSTGEHLHRCCIIRVESELHR